jgi:hypothetical protein
MTEQPDLFEARKARDEGIMRVRKHSGPWFDDALAAVGMLRGFVGTAEDMRLQIVPKVGHPHHHNTWGALTRAAVKQCLLLDTGRFGQMRTKKSHARKTPIYRSAA